MAQGRTQFCWRAEGQFFSGFENSEILDADLSVEIWVEKSGRFVGLDLSIEGTAVVECDRCLGELTLPVSVCKSFSVKFGQEAGFGDSAKAGEREILFMTEDNTDLEMAQVIYDYACLSLPMTKVHEDGECDPDTVKYLSTGDEAAVAEEPMASEDNPFAALKNLFNE